MEEKKESKDGVENKMNKWTNNEKKGKKQKRRKKERKDWVKSNQHKSGLLIQFKIFSGLKISESLFGIGQKVTGTLLSG